LSKKVLTLDHKFSGDSNSNKNIKDMGFCYKTPFKFRYLLIDEKDFFAGDAWKIT